MEINAKTSKESKLSYKSIFRRNSLYRVKNPYFPYLSNSLIKMFKGDTNNA